MRTRIVIQARTDSSRLPGKALLTVRGWASVVLAAQRAANRGADVVVATTHRKLDNALARECRSRGLNVFRGHPTNVLERFTNAVADLEDGDCVVRLTADNLFPDGGFVSELLDAFKATNSNYLGSLWPANRLPYGMNAEAVTAGALRQARASAVDPGDLEHVTPWIRRKFGDGAATSENQESDLSDLRCTMDTLDDYLTVSSVFENVRDPVSAPWSDLVRRLAEIGGLRYNPETESRPRLALGTAQLGMASYGATNRKGRISEEDARALVQTSLNHGIRDFDTARDYGNAETRLGDALRESGGTTVRVTTKLSAMRDLPLDALGSHVRAATDASVLRSCRELRRAKLDALLLHRWEHRTQWGEAAWTRLLELKADGVLRKLGVSVYNPEEAIAALSDPDVEIVQIPFNAVDHRWRSGAFQDAVRNRRDCEIHVRSVFLQGLLQGVPTEASSEYSRAHAKLRDDIEETARAMRRNGGRDLLLAYVRAQPWVSTAIVGAETGEQIAENADAWKCRPLSGDEVAVLHKRFRETPEALIDPRQW